MKSQMVDLLTKYFGDFLRFSAAQQENTSLQSSSQVSSLQYLNVKLKLSTKFNV